jgi:adenylate cyclase
MLNLYLSKQIEVIENHGGIIDKLTGDEVMAVFEGPDMAKNALGCASAITRALRGLEAQQRNGWIGVGIGINTGPVYVGSIGSEKMKDYTVVGNTVNIAAKLCASARKFQVLFTESTKRLLARAKFSYQPVGEFSLNVNNSHAAVFEMIE